MNQLPFGFPEAKVRGSGWIVQEEDVLLCHLVVFPVGYIVWNLTNHIVLDDQEIVLDVFDNNTNKIGKKKIRVENKEKFLSKWVKRPACTTIFPPFSSAITIKADNKDKRDRIAEDFVGCLRCAGNDFQCLNLTFLLSGPAVSAGAFSITPDNFEKAIVVHAARKIPKSDWLNDRDQLMAPTKELSEEFITDCALWSLFADSNQTAALKDVVYEGTTYQIHNHFFPFSVNELKNGG